MGLPLNTWRGYARAGITLYPRGRRHPGLRVTDTCTAEFEPPKTKTSRRKIPVPDVWWRFWTHTWQHLGRAVTTLCSLTTLDVLFAEADSLRRCGVQQLQPAMPQQQRLS